MSDKPTIKKKLDEILHTYEGKEVVCILLGCTEILQYKDYLVEETKSHQKELPQFIKEVDNIWKEKCGFAFCGVQLVPVPQNSLVFPIFR